MTTPMPAEPSDAGSSTPRTSAPVWPADYDLGDQPNQAATEPPEPPEEPEEEPEGLAAGPQAAQFAAPRRGRPRKVTEEE